MASVDSEPRGPKWSVKIAVVSARTSLGSVNIWNETCLSQNIFQLTRRARLKNVPKRRQ